MTEPLTDEELEEWRKRLDYFPKESISTMWQRRALATIDARDKQNEALEWLVGKVKQALERNLNDMASTPCPIREPDNRANWCRGCLALALTVADYPRGETNG